MVEGGRCDSERRHADYESGEKRDRRIATRAAEEGAERGREWERIFFSQVKSHEPFEKLIKEVPGASLETEKTNGIWAFDKDKAQNAKPPFSKLSEELKDGWK